MRGLEVTMRTRAMVSLFVGLMLGAFPARTQNVNMSRPPEIHSGRVPPAEAMRARVASQQFQKDAKELAELCASMPADLDNVRRGVLPQDITDKLKRVEKLSKRIREELTR